MLNFINNETKWSGSFAESSDSGEYSLVTTNSSSFSSLLFVWRSFMMHLCEHVLSRAGEAIIGPTVEPWNGGEITETSLKPGRAIKRVEESKDRVPGNLSGTKENAEHRLLFENGEEALAPRVVAGLAYPGEALLEPEAGDFFSSHR